MPRQFYYALLLSMAGASGLSAAQIIPGVILSNPQLILGSTSNLSVTIFNASTGAGVKISGTVDAACDSKCVLGLQVTVGTTNGASTVDLAWDFSIGGSAASWSMTDGGATTYGSGGPAMGNFTGSALVNTGTFLFMAQGDNPFSITIPNNSIDFAPVSAVPEPASAGLLAAGLAVATALARRRLP